MSIKTEKITLKVGDTTQMDAYIARPDDEERHCGLIIFQEAFGVNAHIRDVSERFAREGYIAIAPELYHRTGRGVEVSYNDLDSARPHREALRDENLEMDIKTAYNWLASFNFIKNSNIACIGFCMGGRVSFLANSILPIKAAISFYGGNIAPSLVDRARELRAPMLFFWGGLDERIDQAQRNDVIMALDSAKKSYVNVEFSDAGHGFFCDARGRSYKPKAAHQAWPLLLEFLKTHLA